MHEVHTSQNNIRIYFHVLSLSTSLQFFLRIKLIFLQQNAEEKYTATRFVILLYIEH